MQRIAQAFSILLLGLFSVGVFAQDDGLRNGILDIQHEWAHVHYLVPEDRQDADFARVEAMADDLVKQYPGRSEPLVWKAIVLSTHAGARGGLGALKMVREARELLEKAEKIDAKVLDGSIYTTLGSLYYQVPGWPLGFGDDDKAEVYLKKALSMNPTGIDANYFYGDFLYRNGHYSQALAALDKALHAPARPNRPVADEGRRKEVQTIIDKIRSKS